MLSLADFINVFVIEYDACENGVEVVLMQKQKPLSFLCQDVKGKNLQLSTYKKELLVLVIAIKK